MVKKILKITGIVLVLLIAFLFAVPYLFEDTIKAKIADAINEKVDAKVSFADADLSLFRDFPQASVAMLQNLDVIILDSLQYKFHPSHLSLEQSLGWIAKLQPQRAYLTHMHVPLDYDTVLRETPENVEPAYDGLSFEISTDTGIATGDIPNFRN